MNYTFAFSGEITVEANSEAEAYEVADNLVAPTIYAFDNCESITVDDISLLEVEEVEEEEEEDDKITSITGDK